MTTDKLKELISLCKGSVTVEINGHKDYYESATEYIGDFVKDIDYSVLQRIEERNEVVKVVAYPDTPISSFDVYHYDLDSALNQAIRLIKTSLV